MIITQEILHQCLCNNAERVLLSVNGALFMISGCVVWLRECLPRSAPCSGVLPAQECSLLRSAPCLGVLPAQECSLLRSAPSPIPVEQSSLMCYQFKSLSFLRR